MLHNDISFLVSYTELKDKSKPRTVSNQEGENDEDITGSHMTIPMLYKSKPKVHAFYVRFTFYIFEQRVLHHEFHVFSFSEVLAWIKLKKGGRAWNARRISEIDWGPSLNLLHLFFIATTSFMG